MYNKNNNLIKESINILITSFQKGKYKEAETLAKNILKNIPDEPISWKILGITKDKFLKKIFCKKFLTKRKITLMILF